VCIFSRCIYCTLTRCSYPYFAVFSILVVVMVLLSIPTQTMQISLLTNQSISKRILNNETNNNTQAIVNELRKMRGILEGSRPRQVILTIVSFFVAIAFTVFGVQLAFRPEKTEIKYLSRDSVANNSCNCLTYRTHSQQYSRNSWIWFYYNLCLEI
jgi:hypothetical protein